MRRDYYLLILLAVMLFVPYLGAVHLFDWDEINFAECSREMLLTGDYLRPQIDFEPFWEKPPLFFWMQAFSMKLFGVNEFAARFPNAMCGLLTLLLAYRIGYKLHDRMFAWLWVLAWAGSLLPHLYFRSGIIDPWFNLLIFMGLYGFIEFRWQFFTAHDVKGFWQKYRWLLLGGWSLGLAVMTKGPTALLIILLVLGLYWARYRFRNKGFFTHMVLFTLATGSVGAVWFAVEYLLHGSWFIHEFVVYQIRLFSTPDAGHGGFFGYHAVVLLIGCFPVSVFALSNLWGDNTAEEELMESDTLASCQRSDLVTWMQLLFWVVLILFSIVRTKILHYSSLAYFPLTYLGSVTIWRAIRWELRPKAPLLLLPLLGLLVGGAMIALPFAGQQIDWLKSLLSRDRFALANLDAHVVWHWWQALPGVALVVGSLFALGYWLKRREWQAAQAAFGGGMLCMVFFLMWNVPNIEGYSQRAAIEFYEHKAREDCFVKPVGFKSYAHLFYTHKPPVEGDKTIDNYPTLSRGNPGKKVYFVAKITNLQDLPELPDCHELYRKNGFVFFERDPAPVGKAKGH
ncbi:MAG: glycosyltransferase family 39 protein [Saprospiraceae bacterium]|nr:glycosyltransferase family 39 protein [Saprospiraceae bacterium]